MVAEFIKKWNTPALRKYVSDHNKVIRFHIGKEIKEARVAYSKFLNVKRRDLKAAQEINIKGMKKNQIIEAILKEPVLVNRIKGDIDNKRAPAGFHYMEGGVIMKGDKHGEAKKEEGGAAEKKKIKLVTFYDDEPKKSNLKTVTKEDIKELGKGKKKRRIVVKESKSLPEVPKPKGKTINPNAPQPPKRKVKKPKILPETPKPKEKKKKELPKTPLTVTRANGSVSVLKKKIQIKKPAPKPAPKKEEPKPAPKAKPAPKPKPISDEAKTALQQARDQAKKAQEEREKLRGKTPKLIKEIPSKLKEKWFRYMVSQYDDEPFSPTDQLDEYEQLKELADEYFENQEIRRDKSLNAEEQSKGGSRVMSITETLKEIIDDDEDNNKKLIKGLFPKLFDALYK